MSTTDQRSLTEIEQPVGLRCGASSPEMVQQLVAPVARRAVEIVRDMCPPTALSRLVTPEVGLHLAQRAALTRRLRAATGHAPTRRLEVTGVRTCVVSDRAVEASCVLREVDRSRFLAMRWELRHSGWRVTVLEIG
ncbi:MULTISPECIES: Rv3235 family protein [unclassified Brachybacterium]|uniref:Rv3235 family protein n=1 Tax=unclassified Brachybacterium TaxID=2623841 RepID=UPI001E3B402A|nr:MULTISPECIES: Rv3235 family protein [unclassified Brachybacterium]